MMAMLVGVPCIHYRGRIDAAVFSRFAQFVKDGLA
jgi:hypothetical protein